MLYELLAGRRPFLGDEPGLSGADTSERVRHAHLWLVAPDPRKFNPSLPENIAMFLLKALAKQPRDRWPDVKTMLETWSRIQHQGTGTTKSAVLTTPASQPFSAPPQPVAPNKPVRQPIPRRPATTQPSPIIPAVLMVIDGPSTGTTLPLSEPDVLVGRGEQCAIRIPDPHISRVHARFRFAQGVWFIQDQGSRNGVYINGQRVQAMRLNPGDKIQLGQTIMVFQLALGQTRR